MLQIIQLHRERIKEVIMTDLVDLQTAQLEVCLTQTYGESLELYHHILQDYAKPIVLYLLLLYTNFN